MEMDPIFAEAMLDEVQALLEEMMELAQRAVEDDCTDEERDEMQGKLIILRERLGEYRDALYAAWKASDEILRNFRS